MMRFKTPDGAVFGGSTSREVVTNMRDHGFYPGASPSLNTYMLDVIERLAFYLNEEIEVPPFDKEEENCSIFISTLIDRGYFTEVSASV